MEHSVKCINSLFRLLIAIACLSVFSASDQLLCINKADRVLHKQVQKHAHGLLAFATPRYIAITDQIVCFFERFFWLIQFLQINSLV